MSESAVKSPSFESISALVCSVNDLLADTRYWAERTMGSREAIPVNISQVKDAHRKMSNRVRTLKRTLIRLRRAISAFNEYNECGVSLDYDRQYSQTYILGIYSPR